MKKALLTLMCIAAMMVASTNVKAQEVTIPLMPGWNWISIPTTDTLDFATALGSFTPMTGDVIKTQWQNAVYRNGHWIGLISQFYPGYGYKYYSTRTMPVMLTFNVQQPVPQVVVTTSEPTDITTNSATCGGNVASSSGDYVFVFLKGICWGTNPNPTFNDNYIEAGNGLGSFTVSMTELTSGSTYYVRAFAVTPTGTFYGEEEIFTTDHEFVDLGLPSGTLWATCNVGANSPGDYGDYFAWGETQPKDDFSWSNYQYSIGGNSDHPNLTKYCNISGFGYNGFTDNLTILEPSDDAAAANWGSDWRMPTIEEWWELYQNTTETNAIQNGVNGRLFTASNGNSIFIPAADYPGGGFSNGAGNYWSSSLYTDYPGGACYLMFGSNNNTFTGFNLRCNGSSVRPVRVGSQNTSFFIDATANPAEGGVVSGGGSYFEGTECTLTATANEGYTFTNWTENDEVVSADATYTFTVNADRTLVASFTYNGNGDHAYVDLGLPSGTLWATCNVGADTPEGYGDYFAWGETTPKSDYSWSTYQYCMGSNTTFTKYCTNSSYGYNGFTDNLTTLLPEDDAATANWGGNWRMPTREEFQELYNNTSVTWTTQNGVSGRRFTASNGNSLFLPAAGYRDYGSLYFAGGGGYYWSSSLYTDGPNYACDLYFYSNGYTVSYDDRYCGRSVRPVRSTPQSNAPTGAINGKFTINADGDQVYFSQGNLQYQASTNTWKFADNQWDYVGEDNANISQTYDGWIDLFGWGTSGYHDANDPYNVNYQPWSTSTLQVNSNYNYWGYGPSTNMTDPNLTGTSANYDWGVYNPISNGGNTVNQWHTLTLPEWSYVFNTRTTTSGIRYARANVNNVNGVILLPDEWSTSTYSLSNTNNGEASFSSNTITTSQWATLENAGAVFLPAAGYRGGTFVDDIGSKGDYWSASCFSSSVYCPRGVYFDGGCLITGSGHDRYNGFSVRVVCPAEN